MSRQQGYTLVEIVVTMGALALITCITLPALSSMLWRATMRGAIARIDSLMIMTQEDAVALGRNRAIKFLRDENGGWSYAIYVDGDGDGVLNADIAKGIDPLVEGPTELVSPRAMATIGIPPEGLPDPDGGPRLRAETAPVQFNRSTLCSFSPDGSGTPGSVYLHTTGGDAAVVRCSGEGGRISVLIFNRGWRKWQSP
jgi:prepilin-type N-terminal cleavage/methylation domain-containing protein